jgi:hypothetical protein
MASDWPEDCTLFNEEIARNYSRNKKLIDLTEIPERICEITKQQFEQQSEKGRDKLFNYFIKNKLKNLTENIAEF